MNFDQILTKFGQTLTIYVKIHQIHVNTNQKCHVLKIQKNQRQKSPRKKINVKNQPGFGVLGYWGGIGVLGGGIN